jgi:hypothetical protein
VPAVLKPGSLNLREPSGAVQEMLYLYNSIPFSAGIIQWVELRINVLQSDNKNIRQGEMAQNKECMVEHMSV